MGNLCRYLIILMGKTKEKKNEKMKNLMSNRNLPFYKSCLLPLIYLGNRILLAWRGWNWNALPWIIKNRWLCWNYKTHIDKDTYIPFSTPPQWPILLQFCTQERTVAWWYCICLSVIQAASGLQQGSSASFFVLRLQTRKACWVWQTVIPQIFLSATKPSISHLHPTLFSAGDSTPVSSHQQS